MAISSDRQASIVHTAYGDVLARLIYGLVERQVLRPEEGAAIVRVGKATLATYPMEQCELIEAAHTGLERLAQQIEEWRPPGQSDQPTI